jgi:hypothetical protein
MMQADCVIYKLVSLVVACERWLVDGLWSMFCGHVVNCHL